MAVAFDLRRFFRGRRLAGLLLTIVVFVTGTIVPFSGPSNIVAESVQAATLEKRDSNTDWCDVGMTAAECGIYTTFVTSSRGVITRDEVVEYVSGTDAISLAQAGLSYSQNTGVWSGTLLPSAAGKRLSFNVNYYDSTFKLRQVYGFSVGFAQTLEWNPTNTAIVTSPTLPSEPARVTSSNPDAVVTYSASSGNSSGCQVNATTGQITFYQTGGCFVIARVEARRSGSTSLSATTKTVLFNIVGWPTIDQLYTTSGPTSGGTSVGISGTGFFGVTSVKFGGIEAQSFTVSSGTYMVAVAPRAASTGVVYVSVTNVKSSGGSAPFTYTKGFQTIRLEPSTTQDLALGGSVTLGSNGYYGTGARTYSVSSGSTYCAISGTLLSAVGVGTCLVTVAIADTTAFYGSTSAATTFRISKTQQVLTWAPNNALTLAQSPYVLPPAVSLGGAPISYSVTSTTLPSCAIDSNSRTLTFNGVGECTVKANVTPIGDYGFAEKSITFTTALASRALTWSPETSLTPGQSGYAPALALGIGSPAISYSLVGSTNGCSVNSTTGAISFNGVGTCSIRASTPATGTYEAGQVERTFTIARLAPALSWSPNLNLLATQDSHDFGSATTLSDSAVTYSVTNAGTTNCSLASSQSTLLVFLAAGSCEVTATVAQSDLYAGSTSVVTFAIGRSSQSFSWLPTTAQVVRFDSIELPSATTALGGGAITYAVTTPGAGCVLASSTSPTLSITSTGTCTVTAYASETSRFAAGTISMTFTFTKSVPVISWQPVLSIAKPETSAIPSAVFISSSDGPIRYSVRSAGTSGCSVDEFSAAITVVRIGSCEIDATSLATDLYESITVTQNFNFVRRSQPLSMGLPSLRATEGGEVTVSAIGYLGSGSLSLSLVSGSSCSVSGMRVSALSPGRCELALTIEEDDNYESGRVSTWLTVVAAPVSEPQMPLLGLPSESQQSIDLELPVPDQSNFSFPLLPPPPTSAKLVPNLMTRTATLTATLPSRSSEIKIESTVIEVRDPNRKLIARISIRLKDTDDQISVEVPYASKGFTVSIFNVNDFGVSAGAPASSQLLHQATSSKAKTGTHVLFGERASQPVFFKAYSAALDSADRKILDKFAGQISKYNQSIYITGYAHLKGSTKSEVFDTSLARARNVARYLASKGVRVWIRYSGAGAPPKSAGWKDRRVELRVAN